MRYKIETVKNGVNIEVTETEGKHEKLLDAFQECQKGRCTCPTREYSKLQSLEIETDEDSIRLRLKSKPDEKFNQSELGKCLEYTKERVLNGH